MTHRVEIEGKLVEGEEIEGGVLFRRLNFHSCSPPSTYKVSNLELGDRFLCDCGQMWEWSEFEELGNTYNEWQKA